MIKLKYIFFIIPLLFFIGSVQAFDIATINNVTINENYIKNYIFTQDSTFEMYDYSVCTYQPSSSWLICNFFTESQFDSIRCNTTGSNSDGSYVKCTFSPQTRHSYINNNGTETFYSNTSSGQYFFYYGNSTGHTYSNFTQVNMTYYFGSTDYNILDFSTVEPEPEPETPIIQNLIYLPDELESGNCPIILNKDTIRVYEEEPQVNVSVNYTDYFINSHYIKQSGNEILTEPITCLDIEDFTTSYVYRFDFDKILIIFIIILFLIAYPLLKIIHAFFIGFKRR